jgi:hypothetical protein
LGNFDRALHGASDVIPSRIALFFGYFAVLIAPWPGVDGAFNAWMRMLGNAAFSRGHLGHEIQFEAIQPTRNRPLDTRIVLTESRPGAPQGAPRSIFLDLDMRGIAWVPTAFLAALVLATPVSWPRRLCSLGWGVAAMHAFVFFSIGAHILRYSIGWDGVVIDAIDETLINQIGAGFFAAVFLWVAVTFRMGDWNALIARTTAKASIPRRCSTSP